MKRALALTFVMLVAGSARAHPHIWATVHIGISYESSGRLIGIQYGWTYDEMSSAFIIQEVRGRASGVATRDELAPLAQTHVATLREQGYFTTVTSDGANQRFGDVEHSSLSLDAGRLTLHFLVPIQSSPAARLLILELYDPSYFVDFDLADADPVELLGAPGQCRVRLERKDWVQVANRITVACP